jgi:hypothetical protein
MRPTRKKAASQLEAEAQGDPEELWRAAVHEIRQHIDALGTESPEGRAYAQLKALMGEGSLLHALGTMLRQVRMAESRLAADLGRKKENASAISKLRSVAALLERRQERAVADVRVNAFIDLTFPLGFIRELTDGIAYFEADNEGPSARRVIGLGKHSGGGANLRSILSIKHAAVGRCAEEAKQATGKNCDKPVGVLAPPRCSASRTPRRQMSDGGESNGCAPPDLTPVLETTRRLSEQGVIRLD